MKLNWFKKKEKQKKEATNTMSTLEEVKKAYEDLSDEDKKSFEQSLKDRVDESVGEQEHLDGETDSQTAKDRVDEAEGEERAVEEEHEERHEERQEERAAGHESRIDELFSKVDALTQKVDALTKRPVEADKDKSADLEQMMGKWGR